MNVESKSPSRLTGNREGRDSTAPSERRKRRVRQYCYPFQLIVHFVGRFCQIHHVNHWAESLRDSGPNSCDGLDKKDSGVKAATRRREEVGERDQVWDLETMFYNLQGSHLAIEVMMLTKITGESVKFIGIMSIQENFIAYIPE